MSTADSWLNTSSVLIAHDIIGKIIPLINKQALLMARTFTFLLCAFAIELAMYKKALIEIEWLACSFYDPLVIVPLTAGFLKFRTNSKSFIAALIIGVSFTAISGYKVGDLGTISLMCGMIGSAIGLFGMHYFQVYNGTLNIAKAA
ncbi:hypothetical protein [Candidatus Lariskella endosymbiont of Hedychridium roseum]|uniref:hypothetical protein n=1 Tax=Candidatus Lariskella endosymbiont of Hedychridium roseum TaxID=3077949 RepID=UPI0030CE244B